LQKRVEGFVLETDGQRTSDRKKKKPGHGSGIKKGLAKKTCRLYLGRQTRGKEGKGTEEDRHALWHRRRKGQKPKKGENPPLLKKAQAGKKR